MAVVGVAVAPATPLAAQTPTGPPKIRGYVFDSLLTHAPLDGAVVVLSGAASRSIKADVHGRFLFDSLPPGSYTITFTHPLLDTTGYAAPERPVEVPARGTVRLYLSTPSGDRVYERLCPGTREAETGVVLGSVLDAASEARLAGAEVRAEWMEHVVSKELGISRRARFARATTDSLGRYQVCGVPNDVPVALRAAARGLTGPPLEVRLEKRSVAVLRLGLDLSDSASRAATGNLAQRGTARLKGLVTREDASPLAEAQVLVVGLPGAARSTASGAFELADLPAGTYTLEVRAIGFQQRRRLIDLRPGRVTEVSLALQTRAAVLPEIKVVGKATRSMAEFDERRTKGGGYFIDQDQIEKRNPIRTEDLFRSVPGLRVLPLNGFDSQIVSSRGAGFNGACSPDFFVDGVWISMDPELSGGLPVNPSEIYGIEVYNGAASAPPDYPARGNCGVVLIWTRRGGGKR